MVIELHRRNSISPNYFETNAVQATTHFEKNLVVFGEIKAEKEVTLAYAGYGGLGKQGGHIAKARKYLTKPLKIFERLGGSNPSRACNAIKGLPNVTVSKAFFVTLSNCVGANEKSQGLNYSTI